MIFPEVNFEKSLYVGCALTHAPQDFRDEVAELKNVLREEHNINVLDFIGLTDGTDEDVYEWDINRCVMQCRAFLGVYGYPGDGLGGETQKVADRLTVPMLGVVQAGRRPSRWTTGLYKHYGQPFETYNNLLVEVPKLVVREFVELKKVL